jgi:FkbM family methyltransferase
MRQLIKAMLAKAGYELHRSGSTRASMNRALHWLREHDVDVATVLDVGASNGCWSRECIRAFPNAEYILFEPQPVHGNALDAFAVACEQKVNVVKKAVGASDGETLFDAADPFGGALATSVAPHTITVQLTTIDSSLAQMCTKAPYLLKLDTHGFEKSILEGATDTLKACEALIIEAYNYRISGEALLFWELCAYLFQKGFRPIDLVDVTHRPHDDSLWQIDLVFVRSSWGGFNYCSYR